MASSGGANSGKANPLKSTPARVLALLGTIAVVVVSQVYYSYTLTPYNHNIWTIVFGVFVPLAVGCFLLLVTWQPVVMFGFVALFVSVVDDAPIVFDWPRLTGFPPGVSHYAMQVYLYEVSIAFFLLSFGLAVWRYRTGFLRSLLAFVLIFFSFVMSYADDIPVNFIKKMVIQNWYALDTVKHVASTILFGLALLAIMDGAFPKSVIQRIYSGRGWDNSRVIIAWSKNSFTSSASKQ